VAIGSLSDAERNDGSSQIVDLLVGIAGDLSQFRSAAEQETPTVNLIHALEEIRKSSGAYLTPTRLLDALRQQPGFDWVSSAKKLSELLRPLGLITRSHRFPEQQGKPQRAYHLDPELLKELESRYAAVSPCGAEEPVYAAEPVADPGVTS